MLTRDVSTKSRFSYHRNDETYNSAITDSNSNDFYNLINLLTFHFSAESGQVRDQAV